MAALSDGVNKNFNKIIIIGGGMAGLSAANHLVKNGMTDFKILEARNRIGGRVIAVDTATNKLELGAMWIHGVLGNPIYEIAMANGLIDIVHAPKPHKVVAALENGKQVPFAVLQEIYEAYVCFLRRCEEYFLCQYLPPQGISSVGEHISLEAELYLQKIENPDERHLRHLIFQCLLKRETCISGCDSMADIDLLELGSYTELQGGNITLPSGYSSILDPISSLIPPSNILKNHAVAKIRWKSQPSSCEQVTSPGYDSGIDLLANGDPGNESDDSDKTVTGGTPTPRKTSVCSREGSEKQVAESTNLHDQDSLINKEVSEKLNQEDCGVSDSVYSQQKTEQSDSKPNANVEIICENGTKLYADHVICTIPLGVLKEKAKELFSPSLPESKLESIDRLLFGTVDKIYLEYTRPFLNPDITEIMLLWDSSEEKGSDLSQNWFKKIYSFTKVTETLFLGWISGREAEYMETLSSEVVAQKCTEILRKFLNDPYIPLPKICICTSWHSQPYSRGSYTSIAVGASQLDIEQIAQPIYSNLQQRKPVLLFAGEHTHSSFYSTVHGAYLTGRSAAQTLLTPDSSLEIEMSCDDTSDLSSWIQGISLE